MKNSSPSQSGERTRPIWKARSTAGAIVVAILIGGYSIVAPAISRQIGIDLPTLTADRDGGVHLQPSRADGAVAGKERANQAATSRSEANESPSASSASRATAAPKQAEPKQAASSLAAPKSSASSSEQRRTPKAESNNDLKYERLREVSPDRFISISGLSYTPGSAEGHRLEHLRRHTADQPGRPGSHGVFDGDMVGAIKTIDLAYERAKKNQRTTKSTDKGRTIYTVDMGKRVGYIGGRDGNRKRKPMARRVRLVLEGNRVITAYPL